MARRSVVILTLSAGLLSLAGCGDSAVSRGTSGAAIGAGTGAAVCAVTIIGILPCAIVGGALGAAGGTATAGPDEELPGAPPPPDAAASPADASVASPAASGPVAVPQPRAGVTAEPLP